MGKVTRVAAVVAAAASLVLAPMASASPAPYADHDDYNWYGQLETADGNYNQFRAAGPDRIDTAIKLMCEATDHVWDGVIIARSDDFADALTSGPLADVTNYALLISPSGSIDARVVNAIKNNCNTGKADTEFKNIVMIGGTGVWSEGVRDGLQTATGLKVTRVAGIDRYDTAVAIAKAVTFFTCFGDVFGSDEEYPPYLETCKKTVNAYVATGLDYPDALTAGAAAAANDGVVLLTAGDKMDARDRTVKFLDAEYEWMLPFRNHVEIHTAGGWSERALKAADIRIDFTHTGANRYETAVLLAKSYAQTAQNFTIASGENYPDGVVAGAWAANHDGPLLLTENAALNSATRDYLVSAASSAPYRNVMVVGGTGSVSKDVSKQLWDALHF